jgi:hypothetical protein
MIGNVIDRRQLILTRLEALLNSLTITLTTGTIPAGNFVHNRDQLPKELVPGVILLDADEVKDPRVLPSAGRSLPGTSLMRMTPEIYVVLDVRTPTNKDVSEDLIKARAALLSAVLHDEGLNSITGANGEVVYDGCVTDLARNRTMRGQMGVSFTFTYPLIPGEINGA